MKYIEVSVNPWRRGCYMVGFTSDTKDIIVNALWPGRKAKKLFSFQFLIINLFGLRPQNFFDYVRCEYGAEIIEKENSKLKFFYFTTPWQAEAFAEECERRFEWCVNEGYFNG